MTDKQYGKTIPPQYHEILFIGKPNRAGEIIDFKHPPTYIYSDISLEQYRELIFNHHIPASSLPYLYKDTRPFILLRPTALAFSSYVEEEFIKLGIQPTEVIRLQGFMLLADSLYELDKNMSFTWKWRTLMLSLHETKTQDQSEALVYFFDNKYLGDEDYYQELVKARGHIRREIGSTPYLFFYKEQLEFGMDLHHLHTPDYEHLNIEYNAVMHAVNQTSIFEQ